MLCGQFLFAIIPYLRQPGARMAWHTSDYVSLLFQRSRILLCFLAISCNKQLLGRTTLRANRSLSLRVRRGLIACRFHFSAVLLGIRSHPTLTAYVHIPGKASKYFLRVVSVSCALTHSFPQDTHLAQLPPPTNIRVLSSITSPQLQRESQNEDKQKRSGECERSTPQ